MWQHRIFIEVRVNFKNSTLFLKRFQELLALKQSNSTSTNVVFKKLNLLIDKFKNSHQDLSQDAFSTTSDGMTREEPFLEYVESYTSAILSDEKDDTLRKINETHDIVPGKYEGGLKVRN